MAFGETLTYLRKARGLSQEQLAEELELTRQTISKWELNQSKPDFDYFIQLSDFFGVTTDYLIKGEQAGELSSADRTDFNSDGHYPIKSNKATAYKWCFCLGVVGIAISLLGIIAFVIWSAISPPRTVITEFMTYEGLLGFLIGTNTLLFFIILVLMFIGGCILSAYGIFKKMSSEQ